MTKNDKTDLPLSRLQVHALRVVVESLRDENILVPRLGFESLVAMAESHRTPGCKRCGVDLAPTPDAKYIVRTDENGNSQRDEYGRVMRFCTEECMAEWDAIENPAQKYIARGQFSGHATISAEALLGGVPDYIENCGAPECAVFEYCPHGGQKKEG